MQNSSDVLNEKFPATPRPEMIQALLVIACRKDELPSVRTRAVRGLEQLEALDNATWSVLIPNASTEMLTDWLAQWSRDDNSTILDADQIRMLFETHRLPKNIRGLGKTIRKFMARGATYTSTVFLPGSKYSAWQVKYDCAWSIIDIDDQDSISVLASFSTMSYFQARTRIIKYIENKHEKAQLTPAEHQVAIGILNQIISDGKTEENTPTMSSARRVLAKLTSEIS